MPSADVARATYALPRLRAHLASLRDLSRPMPQGVRFAPDDHFAFMALFFHAKQLEHTAAVLALDEAAGHPDATLVARSMLEGMWQLQWADQDREPRAHRWRAFSTVYDWRTLTARTAAGEAVAPDREARVLARLAPVREFFLTDAARKAARLGRPEPADPYTATWSGRTVRQLAEATGNLLLYATVYAQFSERHHWDPAGVAAGVQQDAHRLAYDASSPPLRATALSVAFQCLHETTRILDAALALGHADAIAAAESAFVRLDAEVRAAVPDPPGA